MDYKALLEKYMRHVLAEEGCAFAEGWERGLSSSWRDSPQFTRDEELAIGQIHNKIYAEKLGEKDGRS